MMSLMSKDKFNAYSNICMKIRKTLIIPNMTGPSRKSANEQKSLKHKKGEIFHFFGKKKIRFLNWETRLPDALNLWKIFELLIKNDVVSLTCVQSSK